MQQPLPHFSLIIMLFEDKDGWLNFYSQYAQSHTAKHLRHCDQINPLVSQPPATSGKDGHHDEI